MKLRLNRSRLHKKPECATPKRLLTLWEGIVYRSYKKGRRTLAIKKASLTAARILEELKKCGVTHVICLPDAEGQFLYQALTSRSDFTVVPVCREGEAIAIATGLILGGKEPVVLHRTLASLNQGTPSEVWAWISNFPCSYSSPTEAGGETLL